MKAKEHLYEIIEGKTEIEIIKYIGKHLEFLEIIVLDVTLHCKIH